MSGLLLVVSLAMVAMVSAAQARPSAPVTAADDVRELGTQIAQIHPDAYVHPDAVVIGGGIMGAATAFALACADTTDVVLVEAGEPLAQAALRELQEEVGLAAEVVGVLSPTEIILRDAAGRVRHHYVVHPHAARWTGGEPTAGPEALGVRWATLAELATLDTTPGLADTVREAFARAAGHGEPVA